MNYHGPLTEISTVFTIRPSGRLAGNPNSPVYSYAGYDDMSHVAAGLGFGAASDIALGILGTLYVIGEGFQMAGMGGAAAAVGIERATTEYSLEDLPTNWLSLIVGRNQYHGSKKTLAEELADIAGAVLSESDAKCLWDHMTPAEHNQKNHSVKPVLFDLAAHGVPATNAIGFGPRVASLVFQDDAARARVAYNTFASMTYGAYRNRGYLGAWVPLTLPMLPSF